MGGRYFWFLLWKCLKLLKTRRLYHIGLENAYTSSFLPFLPSLLFLSHLPSQTFDSVKPGLEKAGAAISGATHDVIDKASTWLVG